MLDRMKQRANEGRSYSIPMPLIEGLAFVLAFWGVI
jgi:hypothetical protein